MLSGVSNSFEAICVSKFRKLWGTRYHIFTGHKLLEHLAKDGVGEDKVCVQHWLELFSAYTYRCTLWSTANVPPTV